MSGVCQANWSSREYADFEYVWRIFKAAEWNPFSDKILSILSVKRIHKSK